MSNEFNENLNELALKWETADKKVIAAVMEEWKAEAITKKAIEICNAAKLEYENAYKAYITSMT